MDNFDLFFTAFLIFCAMCMEVLQWALRTYGGRSTGWLYHGTGAIKIVAVFLAFRAYGSAKFSEGINYALNAFSPHL